MEININGRNITLHFGMAFIQSLDERVAKIMKQDISQIGYGQGLVAYVQLFLGGDYRSLAIVLYDATGTMETDRPTMQDICDYIEACDDLDSLTNEVLEELKKSGVCAKQAKLGEEMHLKNQEESES